VAGREVGDMRYGLWDITLGGCLLAPGSAILLMKRIRVFHHGNGLPFLADDLDERVFV
jgi:hypothetical protein